MDEAPTETRYQRIGREQAERRAKREKARALGFSDKTIDRQQARARAANKRARRHAEAMEIEADYMPDSFDPPEQPEF